MSNVITYTQFYRIDKLIRKKNSKVQILCKAFCGLMFVSFFSPLMFFITLGHNDLTCSESWMGFLPIKGFQFLIKLCFFYTFWFSGRFFNLNKIHIKRSEMDISILLLMVDIVLEAAALVIICHLGSLIDEVRDGGPRDSDGMRTEWWWIVAVGSKSLCLPYSIYLLIQMTY
jgi:hypothetical protein